MTSEIETRRKVGNYIFHDFTNRNREDQYKYQCSFLGQETGTYAGTIGKSVVFQGIATDLGRQGLNAVKQKLSTRVYIVVSREDVAS